MSEPTKENEAPLATTPKNFGRPSKFTPDTRRRLIELIATGVPVTHAARAVGVSYESFNNYRKQHAGFAEEIETSVSAAIEKRLNVIQKAADAGDVNSAKWLLEHLHPQHFARNRIEVSGVDGSPLTAAIAVYLPQKNGGPATEVQVIADAPRVATKAADGGENES
jgi:transposase-like protein